MAVKLQIRIYSNSNVTVLSAEAETGDYSSCIINHHPWPLGARRKESIIFLAFSGQISVQQGNEAESAAKRLQCETEHAALWGNSGATNGVWIRVTFPGRFNKSLSRWLEGLIQLFSALCIARSSSLAVWLTASEESVNSEGLLSKYHNIAALSRTGGKSGVN